MADYMTIDASTPQDVYCMGENVATDAINQASELREDSMDIQPLPLLLM